MPDNNLEKIIPEHNLKFAFMRKSFMPTVVITGNFFEYIKTVGFSSPFCVVSQTVAKKFEKQLRLRPFSGGIIIKNDGEPTERLVKRLTEKCRRGKYDLLIGVGGGSVLDLIKVIKRDCGLPLVVVPTTPSSGSETTPYALIIDSKAKSKMLVRSRRLMPDVVILDALFLEIIPLQQMGYFLFDILGHCAEGLVSKMSTVFSDAYSQKGIDIISNIYLYLNKPYRKESLSSLQIAGFFGGLTQGMASVGLAHSLAHYFGSKYGVPHAKSVSIFLPEVVRVNSRFETYNKLYPPEGNTGAEYLLKLFKSIERFFGLKKEKIKVGKKFSAEDAIMAIQKDFCAPTNPVRFENKDFMEIFKNTLIYEN
jgi:acetaldehyde dehydrogenase/alcohol dehydrogenase